MNISSTAPRDRVWVEVNLDHLAFNIQQLKQKVGPAVKLMPMLKANAYGCGSPMIGKIALASGADWLGVELVEEALELRRAQISTIPLFVAGNVTDWQAQEIVDYDLHVTVRDAATVNAIAAYAATQQKIIPVHVELDTGLHRLGLPADEALALIRCINNYASLKLEGVWTHFASSENPVADFTWLQFQRYQAFISQIKNEGISIPIRHVANSAALIKYPEMRLELSRCGEAIYGLVKQRELLEWIALKPVMEWKTYLARIQTVAAGESVGYGQTWVAQRQSRIGTLPMGYADGYRRCFSNRGFTLVRGNVAPIVGIISMQATMVDLTDIPETSLNDEVVLMGKQGEHCISAYDLAEWANTAECEILVGISPRVPRKYLHY